MGLVNALMLAANHLGLIKVVDLPAPEKPQKITMRTLTLKDLTAEVEAEEIKTLAQMPAELTVSFPQVLAAAGVKAPAHGWTVEKLQETLADETYRGKSRPEVQKELLVVLQAQQVPVEDLVKDAMARDHAIDAFGVCVQQKIAARRALRQQKAQEAKAQIAELQEQMTRLQAEEKNDETQWRSWWGKKLAYEQALAAAINYLLDKPVVTVDTEPPGDNNSH
ncbi:MAG: hypothetical protein WCI73_04240 [Phycisphaerae bacterium]